MNDKKERFLQNVTDHIKSKEAKKLVADELGHHLREAKQAWIERGLTGDAAEEKAIVQMGSPDRLGQKFNKLYRPRVDWLLLLLMAVTIAIGFLPLLSFETEMSQSLLFSKAITLLLAIGVAVAVMLFDYRKLAGMGWLFLSAAVLYLLALTYLPVQYINGTPVIRIAGLGSFDISLILPVLLLAWACLLHERRLKNWHFAIIFAVTFFMIGSVPSMSTLFLYSVAVLALFWWSRLRRFAWWKVAGVLAGSALLGGAAVWNSSAEYQKVRILAYLNPEAYSETGGWLLLKNREILQNAGWFGNEAGMLTEGHTNFAFLTIISNYGWISAIALISILSVFLWRLSKSIGKTRDPFGRLLVFGACVLFGIQAIYNVAMTFGLSLYVDMPLPFVSYGVGHTIINAILIGIILSVYRRKDFVPVAVS